MSVTCRPTCSPAPAAIPSAASPRRSCLDRPCLPAIPPPMKPMIWIVPLVLALLAGLWLLARATPRANAKPPTEPVTAAHVDAFLAPHQAVLDASRRPVHYLSLEPFADGEPTASKVGGRAWWPQDEPAPTGSKGQP